MAEMEEDEEKQANTNSQFFHGRMVDGDCLIVDFSKGLKENTLFSKQVRGCEVEVDVWLVMT